MRRRTTELLGLADSRRGNVVPHRFRPELLESQSEDAIHAPEIENPFPVGGEPTQQYPLAPEQVSHAPVQVEPAGALVIEPRPVLLVVVRSG
jgi:hypothetical protein